MSCMKLITHKLIDWKDMTIDHEWPALLKPKNTIFWSFVFVLKLLKAKNCWWRQKMTIQPIKDMDLLKNMIPIIYGPWGLQDGKGRLKTRRCVSPQISSFALAMTSNALSALAKKLRMDIRKVVCSNPAKVIARSTWMANVCQQIRLVHLMILQLQVLLLQDERLKTRRCVWPQMARFALALRSNALSALALALTESHTKKIVCSEPAKVIARSSWMANVCQQIRLVHLEEFLHEIFNLALNCNCLNANARQCKDSFCAVWENNKLL